MCTSGTRQTSWGRANSVDLRPWQHMTVTVARGLEAFVGFLVSAADWLAVEVGGRAPKTTDCIADWRS